MFSLYLANYLRICSFFVSSLLALRFVCDNTKSLSCKSNQIWYFISKTRQKQHCYFNKMSATKVGIKSPLQNYGHTSPLQPSLLCKIVSRLMHQAQIQSRNQVWSERGGGAILRLQKFNLFLLFQGWDPKPLSRTHTPPQEHLSICQISTTVVPLACPRDKRRHSPWKTPVLPPLLTSVAPTNPPSPQSY